MGFSTKLEGQSAGESTGRDVSNWASHELARALVRRSDPKSLREIQRLAPDFRYWDSLLDLAQEHRVSQILLKRLEASGVTVPGLVQERLKAEFDRQAFHALASAAELIAILQEFSSESIDAVPFKGVVLASSIYGDLSTRPSGDIDLLIHHRDLQEAAKLIRKRGFELTTETCLDGSPMDPNYYECHFERPTDGLVLELRWRLELVYSKFKRDLGINWVWPTRKTAIVAGAEVPNIDPEKTLLLLCMHGSKHLWSRLIWICDVAQLLEVEREIDWDLAIREAKRLGLWRAVALGVQLAVRMIGVALPDWVLQGFESDAVSRSLALYFETSVFDAPGIPPQSRVPYYFKLLGFRDRVRLLLSLDLLRPSERDIEALRLPKPLQPLYLLFRPLRLLRDKSPR